MQAAHAITLDAVWRSGEEYGDQDIAWTRGFFASLDRFRIGPREMKARTAAAYAAA